MGKREELEAQGQQAYKHVMKAIKITMAAFIVCLAVLPILKLRLPINNSVILLLASGWLVMALSNIPKCPCPSCQANLLVHLGIFRKFGAEKNKQIPSLRFCPYCGFDFVSESLPTPPQAQQPPPQAPFTGRLDQPL